MGGQGSRVWRLDSCPRYWRRGCAAAGAADPHRQWLLFGRDLRACGTDGSVRGGEEGATFREPLWGTRAGAFPSYVTISERSSPSRVRFAAPNNGAPLTDSGPF